MKEYKTLTRSLVRSDPTVTLLLCHSSPAWHGAARLWVHTKQRNEETTRPCLCKMSLGSSQKKPDTHNYVMAHYNINDKRQTKKHMRLYDRSDVQHCVKYSD